MLQESLRLALVRCFSFLSPLTLFSSNLAISYYSDHCPKSIEKVLHSQPRSISNGMWTLAPSAIKHVEYVRLPALGPQHATGPLTLTAPTDIAKRNPSNVHLQTNALSPGPLQSPQPSSQSHISGDPGHWHTHHNIKYLEQLLDSSLATVALIQISGSPLQDVLSPRAYNTFKALYALAALDAPTSSTKPEESEIPTSFIFSDIGNRCPYSCNRSPPLPNSTLVPVPRTGRIHVHVSISVAYVMLFSWAGLAAVSCVLCLSICLGFAK